MNEWKLCSEELPDNDRIVICTGLRSNVYLARYKEGYYWGRYGAGSSECHPLAWMDLPEPYKKEKRK